MEKNLNEYVKRLVELDKTAVELKKERDAELSELEVRKRSELREVEAVLEQISVKAKQRHDELIEAARQQVMEMDKSARLKFGKLDTVFASFRDEETRKIWRQLLDIER